MKITVNGNAVDFSGKTLTDLLVQQGQENAKIATAVNGAFVAASARKDTDLQPGDAVEIVAPRQGG